MIDDACFVNMVFSSSKDKHSRLQLPVRQDRLQKGIFNF